MCEHLDTYIYAENERNIAKNRKKKLEELKIFIECRCAFSDFLHDLQATSTRNADICTNGYQVLVCRKSFEIDGCGMFAKGIVIGQVVCWSQRPFALAADETEITCMVIHIMGIDIEGHTAELLFYGLWRLCQIAR